MNVITGGRCACRVAGCCAVSWSAQVLFYCVAEHIGDRPSLLASTLIEQPPGLGRDAERHPRRTLARTDLGVDRRPAATADCDGLLGELLSGLFSQAASVGSPDILGVEVDVGTENVARAWSVGHEFLGSLVFITYRACVRPMRWRRAERVNRTLSCTRLIVADTKSCQCAVAFASAVRLAEQL